MKGNYKQIILLGSGKLLLDCMEYVDKQGFSYIGYDISEKEQKLSALRAKKSNLNYLQIAPGEAIELIKKETEKTLLFSVINPVILPDEILKKDNFLCINCHQALLPLHKGRNAEAWAIFEGDQKTGITWHKMTSEIDGGDILCQKEIPITEKSTSIEIFRMQIAKAYEAFQEYFPLLITGKERYYLQENNAQKLRYSYEIPENGILKLDWSGEKISRFLRAMDYGGLDVFPKVELTFDGISYICKKYKIALIQKNNKNNIYLEENILYLEKENYDIKLFLVKKNSQQIEK